MTTKVTINSKTSKKYRTEYLNDREHLVTEMVSIVGDSVMNKGLYPLDEVKATYKQLHNLPAPNSHPMINGEPISAFHPLAVNAYNIGGFIRNPRMDGKKVINEFWLDVEIANKIDDGKELVRRIENAEEVGVSTGLTVDQEEVADSNEYEWIARNMQFDHVAILLNEKAAGAHVGTKLQTNSERVLIGFCQPSVAKLNSLKENEMALNAKAFLKELVSLIKGDDAKLVQNAYTVDDLHRNVSKELSAKYANDTNYVWTQAIMPTENSVVYEICSRDGSESKLYKQTYSVDEQTYAVALADDPVEVVKKTEYVAMGAAADAGTESNEQSEEDENMGKQTASAASTENEGAVTVENAVKILESKGFKVINSDQQKSLDFFMQNQSKIEALLGVADDELVALRKEVIANSQLTEDDVKDMPRELLLKLNAAATPPQNFAANGGRQPNRQVSNPSDADYLADYSTAPAK